MPNPVHITAVATDQVCGTIRFLIPLRSMIRNRWCTGTMTYADASIPPRNPVLVQRHHNHGTPFYEALRAAGCRIVHDIDDLLWEVPYDNPNVKWLPPEILDGMFRSMAYADLVTASTEPLAQELRSRGFPAVVLPNVIDFADWEDPLGREPRERLRVGWQGQRNVHAGDLAVIEPAVRALIDRADFVFLGDLPPQLAEFRGRVEVHVPVALELFPATLVGLDLDIVLAPLQFSRFNECKSNLRLLQAGAAGAAVIATDIEPYRGLPVTLVPNQSQDWTGALEAAIADPAGVRAQGERLREAVRERFAIERWLHRYYELWTGTPAPATARAYASTTAPNAAR